MVGALGTEHGGSLAGLSLQKTTDPGRHGVQEGVYRQKHSHRNADSKLGPGGMKAGRKPKETAKTPCPDLQFGPKVGRNQTRKFPDSLP
jgi:hypothetical protein